MFCVHCPQRGIFVAGLREEIVVSPEQVLELMEFGESMNIFLIQRFISLLIVIKYFFTHV
jgi:hypothetical protein